MFFICFDPIRLYLHFSSVHGWWMGRVKMRRIRKGNYLSFYYMVGLQESAKSFFSVFLPPFSWDSIKTVLAAVYYNRSPPKIQT